jgi:hypothetical protein
MVIKLILHDLLFDSCQLRHRQDAGLGRAAHGPFEIMGSICFGILGLATSTAIEEKRSWEGCSSW